MDEDEIWIPVGEIPELPPVMCSSRWWNDDDPVRVSMSGELFL